VKIYLASKYHTKPRMARYAKELRAVGHQVVSRWHDATKSVGWREAAVRDTHDVNKCDILVMFTRPFSPSGGRHVELGLALAMRKRVLLIGRKRENVFQDYPGVRRVVDWKDGKMILEKIATTYCRPVRLIE
jgi:nucleoside 2-deoxyribosyltransferase